MVNLESYDDSGKEKSKDKKEHKYQELHPSFPDASRILLAGPSGSGKNSSINQYVITTNHILF